MFIVGGFNAYPAEIESFLMEHPAVRQAAVIGVPDERLGQVGKAFIVRADDKVTAEELIAWAKTGWPTSKRQDTSNSSTRSR